MKEKETSFQALCRALKSGSIQTCRVSLVQSQRLTCPEAPGTLSMWEGIKCITITPQMYLAPGAPPCPTLSIGSSSFEDLHPPSSTQKRAPREERINPRKAAGMDIIPGTSSTPAASSCLRPPQDSITGFHDLLGWSNTTSLGRRAEQHGRVGAAHLHNGRLGGG